MLQTEVSLPNAEGCLSTLLHSDSRVELPSIVDGFAVELTRQALAPVTFRTARAFEDLPQTMDCATCHLTQRVAARLNHSHEE